MRLSTKSSLAGFEVLRDDEFLSVGLLSHKMDKMLVVLYDPNYLPIMLGNPAIRCVITSEEIAERIPASYGLATAPDPLVAFYHLHEHLHRQGDFYWEHFETDISSEARIDPTARIAPKDVRIGRGTIIGANVVIQERTLIGEDVIIRAGTVIGGEGFEPKTVGGRKIIIAHAGGVKIHNRVEIQALSHIAKSVFSGFTEIGEDTKIDAHVHIAHNVVIAKRCEIAAGAVIAGSTVIGNDVWVGPLAAISSEIHLDDRAFVAIGSVVTRNVEADIRVFGNPARPIPDKG